MNLNIDNITNNEIGLLITMQLGNSAANQKTCDERKPPRTVFTGWAKKVSQIIFAITLSTVIQSS